MDVRMFGPVGAMVVPQLAHVVRSLAVGDQVRVMTDVSAVVSEMQAFAHLSGNTIRAVEKSTIMTVDMESDPENAQVFQPIIGSAHASGPFWVVVLEVLPTNKLVQA